MNQKLVFIRIGICSFAADDFREFLQLPGVAVVENAAVDFMRAGGVLFVSVFQRETDGEVLGVIEIRRSFDGAEFCSSAGSADDEPTVFHAVDFLHGDADRCGGAFVFKHGESVVDKSVAACLFHERGDLLRSSEHGDDEVDEVSGEDVHRAALELREPLAVCCVVAVVTAHDGMDFEKISEPSFFDGVEDEADRGIVAVDIRLLERQFFAEQRPSSFLNSGSDSPPGLSQ